MALTQGALTASREKRRRLLHDCSCPHFPVTNETTIDAGLGDWHKMEISGVYDVTVAEMHPFCPESQRDEEVSRRPAADVSMAGSG